MTNLFTGYEAVHEAVKAYIDGYLGQDAAKLRGVFHPETRMLTTAAGQIEGAPTAAWFDRIEGKRRDGGAVLAARHEVLGIDLTDAAAVAKVRLDFGTHAFTDYLSLLKTAEGWRIVHKIYTSKDA